MGSYEEAAVAARSLSAADQTRLARELAGAGAGLSQIGAQLGSPRPAAPQSVAWLKAERGHAVLATDTGPSEADLPAGADAIAGMWAGRAAESGPESAS